MSDFRNKKLKRNISLMCDFALSALEYIGGVVGASVIIILAMSIIEF